VKTLMPGPGKTTERKRGRRQLNLEPWVWAAFTFALLMLWKFGSVLIARDAFFFRDLGTTQFPAASLVRELGLSELNPYASFGQPYLGNPNLTVPIRLGLAFLSPSQQLLLQWALMLLGMFVFLEAVGVSRESAFFGAITFCCSGYALSSSSFLNTSTSLAVAPWFLWSAVRVGTRWRDAARTTAVWALLLITGEPVVILLTALLGCLLVLARGARAFGRFALLGAIGVVLGLPIHLRTFSAAADSARFLRGYTTEQGLSQSLHILRFPEIFLPCIYGLPGSLVAGAWWGFRVSDGASPYLYSIAFSAVSIAAVAAFGILTRGRRHIQWWVVAVVGIASSFGEHLPGAAAVYAHIPILRAFRYPIRFWFLTSIAMGVLAAHALEYSRAPVPERVRCRAQVILLSAAGAFGVAAIAAWADRSVVLHWLISLGWDLRWRAPADLALAPIVDRIPYQLAIAAIALIAFASFVRSVGTTSLTILLCLMAWVGVTNAGDLMPVVNVAALSETPFVRSVRAINGRVFERAGKDLEPIRLGVFGRYPSDATANLAVAQVRQAWALAGAIRGVRYAYDASPDGSYTLRNQLVQDRLDGTRDWRLRLKWLRAAGVAAVISPNLADGFPGLHAVAREDSIGIPETLFRILPSLPEVRRVGSVVWARSPAAAIEAFEAGAFNEGTSVVVEGVPLTMSFAPGSATIIRDGPDEILIRTAGSASGILFVARTYRQRTRAWSNELATQVYPANVHLLGIVVPRGQRTVRIRL